MYLVASLLKCKGTAAGDHFLLWCLCPFGGAFFSGEETRSCKGNQKASASHVSRTQKHGTLLFVRTSYLADFFDPWHACVYRTSSSTVGSEAVVRKVGVCRP